MLVLSRKQDECIVIGDGPNKVIVHVVSISGDKVRLGFEAPRDVPVHRQEVHTAITRQNRKFTKKHEEGFNPTKNELPPQSPELNTSPPSFGDQPDNE